MSHGIQTFPVPDCPECGGPMRLRKPRKGQDWDPFWGCADYPECKGTRNIREDGKPEDDTMMSMSDNKDTER